MRALIHFILMGVVAHSVGARPNSVVAQWVNQWYDTLFAPLPVGSDAAHGPEWLWQTEIGTAEMAQKLAALGWNVTLNATTLHVLADSNGALELMVNRSNGTLLWRPCCSFSLVEGAVHARYWALGGPQGILGNPRDRCLFFRGQTCNMEHGCTSNSAEDCHGFDHGDIYTYPEGTLHVIPPISTALQLSHHWGGFGRVMALAAPLQTAPHLVAQRFERALLVADASGENMRVIPV